MDKASMHEIETMGGTNGTLAFKLRHSKDITEYSYQLSYTHID